MIVAHYPGVGYVAYDNKDEGDAGGYCFVPSPSQAIDFPSQAHAADWLAASGPQWALDMAKKGQLTIKGIT